MHSRTVVILILAAVINAGHPSPRRQLPSQTQTPPPPLAIPGRHGQPSQHISTPFKPNDAELMNAISPQLSPRDRTELWTHRFEIDEIYYYGQNKPIGPISPPATPNHMDHTPTIANLNILKIGEQLHFRYEIVKLVGAGGTAVVYEAIDHKMSPSHEHSRVALKFADIATLHPEVTVLQRLRDASSAHSYAKQFFALPLDSFVVLNKQVLVFALRHSDLLTVVQENDDYPIPDFVSWSWVSGLAYRIVSVMKFLEENNVCHVDVKMENILLYRHDDLPITQLTDQVQAELIDFGHATSVGHMSCGGTHEYMPPEIVTFTEQGQMVRVPNVPRYPGMDVFSLGITLLSLVSKKFSLKVYHLMLKWCTDMIASGRYNDPNRSTLDTMRMMFRSQLDRYIVDMPNNRHRKLFVDFVANCLEPRLENRISLDDALRHPFVRESLAHQ